MKFNIDFDHIQPKLIYQITGDQLIQGIKEIIEESINAHSENAIRRMQLKKDSYLSVLETCELLGVTRQFLRKLEKKGGGLQACRPKESGKIFYKLSDIHRFMEGI